MSQRDIASLTGRPLSSINRIVKAFRDEQRLENLPRGSRSKATTDDEDRMIVAAAVDDPTLTAKEIQAELNLQVSVKTIRNRLHEAGLRSRVPARKPLLSAVNRQKQLQFAQEHTSWSPADWENVLFSDESTFTTRWDQRQRIWRADNTRFQAPYLQRVASSGRCAVSVWGAVSKDGLGPLIRLDGRFNSASYKELVETVLLPYALNGPFSDGCFYFQQDCSPIHKARSVRELLEDRGVMTLDWPPQGADMNIIENAWGAMKKALSNRPLHRGSKYELWAAVEAEWERLRASDLFARLFESLPRRMAAVVAAGGDFTKY
ncbi:hypothetical protein ISCGN_005048 [Ixodes scapularis]